MCKVALYLLKLMKYFSLWLSIESKASGFTLKVPKYFICKLIQNLGFLNHSGKLYPWCYYVYLRLSVCECFQLIRVEDSVNLFTF